MNKRLEAITNQAGLPAAFPVRTSSLLMRALSDSQDAAAEPPRLGGCDALLQAIRNKLTHGPTRMMVIRADRMDAIAAMSGEAMAERVRATLLQRLVALAQPGALIAELGAALFAIVPPAGDEAPAVLARRASLAFAEPIIAGKRTFHVAAEAAVFELEAGVDARVQLEAALAHDVAARSFRPAERLQGELLLDLPVLSRAA